MKINKKVLIPVFATAMGLSVIGGVSGAVAWYQYNTKVAASWIGVTTADGGVLQISKDDGANWDSYADFGSATTKLHPITMGALGATDSLEGIQAKKHPEAGVTDPTEWDNANVGYDYFQYTFKLRAQKLDPATHAYVDSAALVKFADLHISAVGDNTDVGEALRVHISDGTNHKLVSKSGGSTDCFGPLALVDGIHNDKNGNYQWETEHGEELVYGNDGDVQTSTAVASLINQDFMTVPAGGVEVTFTIWLEGWQKLRSNAIWDATKDDGVSVRFGMKLSTPETTFVND